MTEKKRQWKVLQGEAKTGTYTSSGAIVCIAPAKCTQMSAEKVVRNAKTGQAEGRVTGLRAEGHGLHECINY